MSEFVIKETIYADQDPESYYSQIMPPQYGSASFVNFVYLDLARKFKTKAEAEAVLKTKEFANLKCIVVEFIPETKKVKKGYYLVGNKIKFHYVHTGYDLNGRGEFTSEKVLMELIDFVRDEIAKEVDELRSNFAWATDLEDQVNRKETGILKKYGLDS